MLVPFKGKNAVQLIRKGLLGEIGELGDYAMTASKGPWAQISLLGSAGIDSCFDWRLAARTRGGIKFIARIGPSSHPQAAKDVQTPISDWNLASSQCQNPRQHIKFSARI